MENNFINKLKNNLKIKNIEKDQPINLWIFVLFLNLIGFIGLFLIKNM